MSENVGNEGSEETSDDSLDALIEEAQEVDHEYLEPCLLVDTFGTIIDFDQDEFNEIFFQHAEELGYTAEQVRELKEIYRRNPKDPKYLRETGLKKVELIRRGIYEPRFFPDALDFMLKANENAIDIVTASKGGILLLKEMYNTPLPVPRPLCLDGEHYYKYGDFVDVVSTSEEDFRFKDKEDPRSYVELVLKQYLRGKYAWSYTSDDPREVQAAAKASDMLRQTGIPELHRGIIGIEIPPHLHSEPKGYTAGSGNRYVTDNLPSIIDISLGVCPE